MRCTTFLDRYDSLDSGEEPGFLLRAHLSSCPECRRAVSRLDQGLGAWRSEEAGMEARALAKADILDERIMVAVRLLPRPKRELRAGDWAVSGVVFLLSLAFIPFSKDFSLFRELFGETYTLPLFLVLGLGLTLFGSVFIATHLVELEPYVKRHLGGEPRT